MKSIEFTRDQYRKSSFSPPSNGGCVEIAQQADAVAVRDSKDPEGPVLVFTRKEWGAFVKGVKAGEFNP